MLSAWVASKRVPDFVDGLVDAAVHDLLLEGAEEALDDAVGLGLGDEGETGGDAPEPDLLLEMLGHEVGAVVVAQREAAGGVGAEFAELLADRHADGLGGFEAGADLADVPAEEFGVPVLDDAEQPDLAILHGDDLGGVGGPHDVRCRGDDVAVVRGVGAAAGAVRRQQRVLPHQPQHALAGDAHAIEGAQPGPDLAVSLAGPGRAGEVGLDGIEQRRVGDGRLRPAWLGRRCWRVALGLRLARGIEGRARLLPDVTDADDAVALAGGRGGRIGHQRDLRRAKGPGRSMRERSSSFSIDSSPMRRIAAASSTLAGSPSRSLSAPSSAASALVRHCSNL